MTCAVTTSSYAASSPTLLRFFATFGGALDWRHWNNAATAQLKPLPFRDLIAHAEK